MERILEDIILLVFMHTFNTFLFVYIAAKLFLNNVSIKKLIFPSLVISLVTFIIREVIILKGLPNGLFIPINFIIFIIGMVILVKMPWRYAILGILISFLTILLWSPIAFLIVKQLGWKLPTDNLLQNFVAAYLEMFGSIILAAYLRFAKGNIFKFLPANKIIWKRVK